MTDATLVRGCIAATLAGACGCAATSAPVPIACTREGYECQRDVERPVCLSVPDGERSRGNSSREGKHAREPKHANHEARVPRR